MRRTHVHFATGEPPRKTPQPHNPADSNTGLDNEEEEAAAAAADGEGGTGDGEKAVVVSGMRATASVLVWVDVRRAMDEGGIAWWRSGNGVVLTEGDGAGMVGLRFVRRVVRRGTGEVIWMPEGGRGREGRSGLDGIGDRNSWQARLAVGLGTRNVGRRKRGWGEGQTEVENR